MTTFLFLIFLALFYTLGGVIGYNTKREAVVKAFIFAASVFVVYYVPFFFFFGINDIATIIIIVWSLTWFIITYLQAIFWWEKIIERK